MPDASQRWSSRLPFYYGWIMIGIAFVTTSVARRSQFHQSRLAAHTGTGNPWFTQRLTDVTNALERAGSSPVDAAHKALAAVYRQLQQQALQLAYLDALKVMAIAVALMLPVLLFAKPPKKGTLAVVH